MALLLLLLFCGRSGQNLGAVGGRPPEPPLLPARSHTLRTLHMLHMPPPPKLTVLCARRYAGSPVIAVASGGPLETVVDGETGFLREGTPEAFAEAAGRLARDVGLACRMGQRGNAHVREKFGLETFEGNFRRLLGESGERGRRRRAEAAGWGRLLLTVALAVVLPVISAWAFR
jgi:glycosyltransferase involved in cell wall biosynthesis